MLDAAIQKVLVGVDDAGECIICFDACSTTKEDMPETAVPCRCKYSIHAECFEQWIMRNEGDIICVICRQRQPAQHQPAHVVIMYEYNNENNICMYQLMCFTFALLITVLYAFIVIIRAFTM